MDRGHGLHRQFNAQITARHHDTVRRGKDFLKGLYGGGLFDLRQQCGPAFRQVARFIHVGRALHERQRQPIDAQLTYELKIAAVFFGQRSQGQYHIRHVHALAVRNRTAGHNRALCEIGPAIINRKPQFAVVHQQRGTRAKGLKNLGVGQLNTGRIAGCIAQIKSKRRTGLDLGAIACKHTAPQLWPLQIRKDRDGPAGITLQISDHRVARPDLRMITMAHVQAEHIRARLKQRLNRLIVVGCGPQSSHDFHIPMPAHSARSF